MEGQLRLASEPTTLLEKAHTDEVQSVLRFNVGSCAEVHVQYYLS